MCRVCRLWDGIISGLRMAGTFRFLKSIEMFRFLIFWAEPSRRAKRSLTDEPALYTLTPDRPPLAAYYLTVMLLIRIMATLREAEP